MALWLGNPSVPDPKIWTIENNRTIEQRTDNGTQCFLALFALFFFFLFFVLLVFFLDKLTPIYLQLPLLLYILALRLRYVPKVINMRSDALKYAPTNEPAWTGFDIIGLSGFAEFVGGFWMDFRFANAMVHGGWMDQDAPSSWSWNRHIKKAHVRFFFLFLFSLTD